jgi:hypothetical protein
LNRDQQWSEIPDHLEYLGSATDHSAYAEFVYFHPCIQNFLYDRVAVNGRPLRLFKRETPGRLDVEVRASAEALKGALDGNGNGNGHALIAARFGIERIHLYLFELGVAILAFEVSLPAEPRITEDGVEKPLSLAHALALQNALRRLYPPYFLPGNDSPESIPEFPCSMKWSGAPADAEPLAPDAWIKHVADKRRNPVASVWRDILAPLPIDSDGCPRFGRWRQIIDERIPSMVCVGVRDLAAIERSDYIRLCFLDAPGRGLPYAEKFLDGFEADHSYDRHFYGDYGTRYFFSGYSMVMIGSGDPARRGDMFHDVLSVHFRRHYFQMGLLIQLQFATLLALSNRVSCAVADKRAADSKRVDADAFRKTMLAIEGQFLQFEQRYYFSQISNQLQAQEIYTRWIDRTGISSLYRETGDQIRAANAYLDARAQDLQSEAATRLSVIATYGVIVGAAFSFLGMNVLASPELLDLTGVGKSPQGQAGAVFAVLCCSFLAGLLLLTWYKPPQAANTFPRLEKHLGVMAGICGLAAAILILGKIY